MYEPNPEIQRIGRAYMAAHAALHDARNVGLTEWGRLAARVEQLGRELDDATTHLRPDLQPKSED